jgi:hypothetical protein
MSPWFCCSVILLQATHGKERGPSSQGTTRHKRGDQSHASNQCCRGRQCECYGRVPSRKPCSSMAAYRRRPHQATANSRTNDGRRRRYRPRVVPTRSARAQNAREGLAARLNDFTLARLRDRSHNRSLDYHWLNNINFADFFCAAAIAGRWTLAAPPAFVFRGSRASPTSPQCHKFAMPQRPLRPYFYCRYSYLRK